MRSKHTFLPLFCGCGGLDLGFEHAGFAGVGAFDCDAVVVDVHNKSLKAKAAVCDLATATHLDAARRPDVVIAGPPCQGFSTLGKRQENDPRNSLIVTAARLAIAQEPRVVVVGNRE